MDDGAVAGQAGAVAALRSHYNSVLLSTVQVAPGAGGGVGGETRVGVAIKPSCHGNVCFSAITGPPADRAHVRLTLYIGGHMVGDTWTWGERKVVSSNIHKCVTQVVCCKNKILLVLKKAGLLGMLSHLLPRPCTVTL